MKPPLKNAIFHIVLLFGIAASTEKADTLGTPQFKILYEAGYYDEAITMIKDSLALDTDTATTKQLLLFLASCYGARGDREQGIMVFKRLLAVDPEFQLDTVRTSPKILDIFKAARSEHEAIQTKTDTAMLSPTPSLSPVSAKSDSTTILSNAGKAVRVDSQAFHLWCIPLGFVPGGAGQFYHREYVKGAILFAAQAASIAVCVWSVGKRDGRFDLDHGWYEGNQRAYNRYTNYARIGFGIGVGSYIFGAIDYFVNSPKR